MTPARSRRPLSSASGSGGCSPFHPVGSEEKMFLGQCDYLLVSYYFSDRTYRQAVVLQQVSQNLDQSRKRWPLFRLALPAGQHDAISTSRGQQSHNNQHCTLNLIFFFFMSFLFPLIS